MNLCKIHVNTAGFYGRLHCLFKVGIIEQGAIVHVRYRGSRWKGKIDKQNCKIERRSREKQN